MSFAVATPSPLPIVSDVTVNADDATADDVAADALVDAMLPRAAPPSVAE
jgi:hypothetical protein